MERKTLFVESEAQYKALVNSVFNEIKDRTERRFDTSGKLQFEDYQPSYDLNFDNDKQMAIIELEEITAFSEEMRRYLITEDSIEKTGYRDDFGRSKYQCTYYGDVSDPSTLSEDELYADPPKVEFYELEALAKLVFHPEANAKEYENIPHFYN